MPRPRAAARGSRRKNRRHTAADPSRHHKSRSLEPGTRDGGLPAVSSRNHKPPPAPFPAALQSRAFLVHTWPASCRLPPLVRQGSGQERGFRGQSCRISFARVGMFLEERREASLHDLPRSPRHSSRRECGGTLQRRLPKLPPGFAANEARACRRRELRGVSHAEAPDRRCRSHRHNRPQNRSNETGRRPSGREGGNP